MFNKKTLHYWAVLFAILNLATAAPQITHFLQTGLCRNYLEFGSSFQACSLAEFTRYGWSWVSVVNLLLFAPAAVFMTLVRNFVHEALSHKN